MSLPFAYRVNVGASFPTQVFGAEGIEVSRANGIYTIGEAFETLATTPSLPNPAQMFFKARNSVTGVYSIVPASLLLAASGAGPGGSTGQVQTNNGASGFSGITNAQLTALINTFSATLAGAVPASGGGTINYLRADGTWATPAGGGGGSLTWNTVVVTTGASYSVTPTDDLVIVQKTTGSATTVNLPSSTSRQRPCYIKDGKGDAGTNTVTIVPAGETIDGLTSLPITTNYGSVMVAPNPAGGWVVVSYG